MWRLAYNDDTRPKIRREKRIMSNASSPHRWWYYIPEHVVTRVLGAWCASLIQRHAALLIIVLMAGLFYRPLTALVCGIIGIAIVVKYGRPLKRKRKHLSKRARRVIFDTSRGACFYCTTPLVFEYNDPGRIQVREGAWQVEHLQSHADDGSDTLENLVAACVRCNQERALTMQKLGKHSVVAWMVRKCKGRVRCTHWVRERVPKTLTSWWSLLPAIPYGYRDAEVRCGAWLRVKEETLPTATSSKSNSASKSPMLSKRHINTAKSGDASGIMMRLRQQQPLDDAAWNAVRWHSCPHTRRHLATVPEF